MVKLFLDGGLFMWPILVLWVLGFMISLERVYTLTKASFVTKSFIRKLHKALDESGVDAAVELCKKTAGPIPAIFHAGLARLDRGIEAVEKAIEAAASVEMAFLERGMIWLATVITLAPMLGFTGTVSGMVRAFQDIARLNDISPSVVAGGISEALLTTLFGLIVAMSIQILYNFFSSRVDKIIIDMEENTVNLIDTLVMKHTQKE